MSEPEDVIAEMQATPPGHIEIYQYDDEGLWPSRESTSKILHGVAFLSDDRETAGEWIVRYVGKSEEDARGFARIKSMDPRTQAVYVRAEQDIEITRSDWKVIS